MKKPLTLVVTTLLALLMLSGCYRMDMSLKFNADDTVDGSVALGIKDDALDSLISMSGGSEEDFWNEMTSEMSTEGEDNILSGADPKPWKVDGYTGREFALEDATLKDFKATGGDSSNVVHADGKFEVTLDMSEMKADETEEGFNIMGTPVLRFEFEFPGKVTSAPGGDIDGNKVVYLYDSKEKFNSMPDTISITALDKGDGGSNTAVLLVVGLLIVAGGAIGVALVAKSGKRDKSDEPGDPAGDGAPRESRVSPFATADDDLAPGAGDPAGDDDDWDRYGRP